MVMVEVHEVRHPAGFQCLAHVDSRPNDSRDGCVFQFFLSRAGIHLRLRSHTFLTFEFDRNVSSET